MQQNTALDAHQYPQQEQQRQAELCVVGDVADTAADVTDMARIVSETRSRAEVDAGSGFTGGGADASLDDVAHGIGNVFDGLGDFLGGLGL